jgi:phosphate starvation-inducible protein PhoH
MIGDLKPLTEGQENLVKALNDDKIEIVGVFGPTGTGKSLFSCSYGISQVINGKKKRFIILRPLIDVTTGKTTTPEEIGDLYYKLASSYLEDILGNLINREEIVKLMHEDKIVVTDVSYLRGRTFDDAVILLDDAQSVKPESATEVLMRMGRNSKLIIAGDPILQKPFGVEKDGATLLREVLLNEEKSTVIDLGLKDIVRPGAKKGVKIAFELRMRKRELSQAEKQILDSLRVHAPDADVVSVIEFKEEKNAFEIKSDSVPEALVIAKEGYLGRVVGKNGERIKKVEEETKTKIRTIEMTLNFKEWIRALHPVSWINKHIIDADFGGPDLIVKVNKEEFGAFVGQKGSYIRFMDRIFRKLINVGIRAIEVERR